MLASPSRTFFPVLAVLLLAATVSPLLQADIIGGIVGAAPRLKVVIREAGSQIAAPNLSPYLQVNPTTGDVGWNTSLAMPNANWNWVRPGDYNYVRESSASTNTEITWQSVARNEADDAARSSFSIFAAGNIDPFMTYAFAARNNTLVTQTYTFTYGEAIVPTVTGSYSLLTEISGSLTNAPGTGTAKIAPVAGDPDGDTLNEIQVLKLSTDGGLTFINAGVDVGPMLETTNAGGNTLYPLYVDSLIASGLGINYWEIETTFTLTPGKDAVGLSGYVELILIPEPSAYAALLGTAGLLAALRRRRHPAIRA